MGRATTGLFRLSKRLGLFHEEQGRLGQPLGSKVLIKVWPVYSVAHSGNAPVRPLLCRRKQQTWIPSQRNRYNSAVEKINAERVVSNAQVPLTLSPALGSKVVIPCLQ